MKSEWSHSRSYCWAVGFSCVFLDPSLGSCLSPTALSSDNDSLLHPIRSRVGNVSRLLFSSRTFPHILLTSLNSPYTFVGGHLIAFPSIISCEGDCFCFLSELGLIQKAWKGVSLSLLAIKHLSPELFCCFQVCHWAHFTSCEIHLFLR